MKYLEQKNQVMMSFIKNHKAPVHNSKIALFVLLLFCGWAILAIQLRVTCLQIHMNWSQDKCDNLNQLFINLTYSFLAGYVFYLLTIYFPQRKEKKRIQPVIRQKVLTIRKAISDFLLEFSRDTDIKKDFLETDNAKIILMSKNWTDTIPMFQYLYKARISYLAYIGEVGKKIQKDIVELIQSYQKYMTTEQVCLLEELSSMQIFAFANQFKQINISLEDKNGKESIVGFFIDAIRKMNEIEDSFSLKNR